MNLPYIMIGGAIGAALRYAVGQLCAGSTIFSMPIATLTVNLLGCFFLGLLTAAGEQYSNIHKGVLLMLTVGMCGAFTTFSTFSAETVKMMNNGHILPALAYVSISVIAGFLLFWLGKGCL